MINRRLDVKLFVLVFLLLIIGFSGVVAQEGGISGTGGGTTGTGDSGSQIEYGQQQNVGQHFGLEPDKVTAEGMTKDQNVNIESKEGLASVSGQGDFKLRFRGEEGEKDRVYGGFQYNEGFENKLVFDKDNELTDGTSFKSDGGEQKEGEEKQGRKVDIKGYELNLNEGDAVNIQNGETTIATKGKITPPEKVRDVERDVGVFNEDSSKENPYFKFRAPDGAVIDNGKEGIKIKGTINYQGKEDSEIGEKAQAIYQGNEELNIEDVDVTGDGRKDSKTEVYFNSKEVDSKLSSENPGILLDKEGKVSVWAGNKPSPELNFGADNPYVKYNDNEKRNLDIQAVDKNSRIDIYSKEGEIPTMKIYGGAQANLDYKGAYVNEEKRDLMIRGKGVMIKDADAKGSSTIPMKIEAYDSKGNPISDKDLYVNARNQFAVIPKNVNWDENAGYFKSKDGGYFSPRTAYNYLPEEQQKMIYGMSTEQKLALEKQGFYESSPGKQYEMLQSILNPVQNVQQAPAKIPYFKEYAGPETRAQSKNFIVNAPGGNAKKYAAALEYYRKKNAIDFTGKELPDWSKPAEVTIRESPNLGNGGATTFIFDRREVFGWRMSIQGSETRLLDSVIPHEVEHMISASNFRAPLPRWVDEGMATLTEHPVETKKYENMLNGFLRTGRGISFNNMFSMKDYPRDVLPIYAQGYSTVKYLSQLGDGGTAGKQRLYGFVADGMKTGNWNSAIKKYYGDKGISNTDNLQTQWLEWVKKGMPNF